MLAGPRAEPAQWVCDQKIPEEETAEKQTTELEVKAGETKSRCEKDKRMD